MSLCAGPHTPENKYHLGLDGQIICPETALGRPVGKLLEGINPLSRDDWLGCFRR
jgi:hypothetical protein